MRRVAQQSRGPGIPRARRKAATRAPRALLGTWGPGPKTPPAGPPAGLRAPKPPPKGVFAAPLGNLGGTVSLPPSPGQRGRWSRAREGAPAPPWGVGGPKQCREGWVRAAGAGAAFQASCPDFAASCPTPQRARASQRVADPIRAVAPAPAPEAWEVGVPLRALQPGGIWNLPTRRSPRSLSAALGCEVAEDAQGCGAWLLGWARQCRIPGPRLCWVTLSNCFTSLWFHFLGRFLIAVK